MLQAYLSGSGWLILHDVFIGWGQADIRPLAPDITAIRDGKMPPKGEKSYVVGRDGPLPEFVVEITSEETRPADLETKKALYAARRLSFTTVGLRFIVVEQRIEVYELATGQRLLNNEEANLRTAELESKLRVMEAKLRQAGIEP